jgi:hypothetical protein
MVRLKGTTKTKSGARKVGAVVAAVALVAGVAPAAQAATSSYPPPTPFRVDYGATYTAGTVTFYNRAVRVSGEQKAVASSGCRYTWAKAFNAAGFLADGISPVTCGKSEQYTVDVPADVVGGATHVEVSLMYYDGTSRELGEITVWR